jgi:hypothetical protein
MLDTASLTHNFHRGKMFHKAVTTASNTMAIVLPLIGDNTSFHIIQHSGPNTSTLRFTPDAANQVNSSGLGVNKDYLSTGAASFYILVGDGTVWHVYHALEDHLTLASAGGCTVAGTYPNYTISVP